MTLANYVLAAMFLCSCNISTEPGFGIQVEAEETVEMIPEILDPLRFLASEKEIYTQRLRYGLKEYYLRNYKNDEE